MGLYLGKDKMNIILDGVKYGIYLGASPKMMGVKLLTSDGFVLKDINGLFITAKENE